LWLVVLSLACEAPMHPYRMQALIEQRGKNQIANVAQRNSVYQTIEALRRAGLIAVRETSRDESRPERTVYQATAAGRRTLRAWMRDGLSTIAREFPEFPAVLSLLDPKSMTVAELCKLLEARATALDERLAELETPHAGVPRLFLLEAEYMAALVRAEAKWLRAVVRDFRTRKLAYPTKAQLRALTSS
jgi:DNA-binding PadR family transcriptional regulator